MASPKHNPELMIQEVLEEFNFSRVEKTMKALDWEWALIDGTPTVNDLRRTAEQLLRGCINGAMDCNFLKEWEPYYNSTGGFKAYCYRSKFKHITSLHLEFIVSEWESDGD